MSAAGCINDIHADVAAVQGEAPLVIGVASADIIASILALKAEAAAKLKTSLKFTLIGGAEAHILAEELGAANIGVILAPARPFPNSWEERRMYVVLLCAPCRGRRC